MAADLNPVQMDLLKGADPVIPDTTNSTSGRTAQDQEHPPSPGLPGPPSAVPDGQDDAPQPEIPSPDQETSAREYPELSQVRQGELRTGTVVNVSPAGVIVDIGRKTEGIVSADDFGSESELPAVGAEINVVVVSLGEPGDYASLSYQSAQQRILWDRIESAHRQRLPLTGRVVAAVKAGLTVDVGLPAFLPSSQVDIRPPDDPPSLVGSELEVRVVKFNRARGNVVVSRRVLLEEEIERLKTETLSKLSEGAVVNGAVKNVTNYGAFVDLGGIDALLHITDLSYSRVKHPADIVKVGESVTAKVIKFDAEREKVSLSLKALEPDPWENVAERYQVGDRTTGRVCSIADYGAFVEVEKGLEGLIHSSEMSWSKRTLHPSKVLQVGQEVECLILKVEPQGRRLSLSLKQLRPDPWTSAADRYKSGVIVEGKVLNMASYGAFVEVEEGIDGLIHITDLTRDANIRHPKQILKKGRKVEAVVLRLDTENRRLSLGVKQLEPDGWDTFFSSHSVDDIVEGRVTRRVQFGVFVEVAPGVEALCHSSEFRKNSRRKSKSTLQTGQSYPFKILSVDDLERRIRLSRRGLPEEAFRAAQTVEKQPKAEDSANAQAVVKRPKAEGSAKAQTVEKEPQQKASRRARSAEKEPKSEASAKAQVVEKEPQQKAPTKRRKVKKAPKAEGEKKAQTAEKELPAKETSTEPQAAEKEPAAEVSIQVQTAEKDFTAEASVQPQTVSEEPADSTDSAPAANRASD